MSAPLVARLLLDAQAKFVRIADSVPSDADRHVLPPSLNQPGWVIAHTAAIHDSWILDAQGKTGEAMDPWLRAWAISQGKERDGAIGAPLDEARAALGVSWWTPRRSSSR